MDERETARLFDEEYNALRQGNPLPNKGSDPAEMQQRLKFAQALSQIDFSRGKNAREKLRTRILEKAQNQEQGRNPGISWMDKSHALFSTASQIGLLILVVLAVAWAVQRLIPKRIPSPLSASTPTTTSVPPTSTAKPPAVMPTVQPTSTPNENFATPSRASEMVKELNNDAISQLPVGWIHIREKKIFDRDTESNGVLPNGVAIPNHQINDIWYQLNESHQVVESVTIMSSATGEEVQVGVYSDGTTWNSATGVFEPSEPYSLSALDGQFLWDLNNLSDSSIRTQIFEEVLSNGRKGLLFVINEKFEDKPLQISYYKLPIIQTEIRALFGQYDGYLHSKEVVFQLSDGSERVSLSLKQEITFEEPPKEVFSYIEMKEKETKK